MVTDLGLKLNEKMNCSINNTSCYLYNGHPLLSDDWDYAFIVEIEDDKKTGRINLVRYDGKEIAVLVSHIGNSGSSTEMFHACESNSVGLMDELRKYLPKQFKK